MHRRTLLALTPALFLPRMAQAAEPVFYQPGNAEADMQAGRVVFLDFWTNWCSTCAAQGRVIEKLRAENPAYDRQIRFYTVDWDKYAGSELASRLQIPRRSVLVALKGKSEIGRVVVDTRPAAIKALMDAALGAATA